MARPETERIFGGTPWPPGRMRLELRQLVDDLALVGLLPPRRRRRAVPAAGQPGAAAPAEPARRPAPPAAAGLRVRARTSTPRTRTRSPPPERRGSRRSCGSSRRCCPVGACSRAPRSVSPRCTRRCSRPARSRGVRARCVPADRGRAGRRPAAAGRASAVARCGRLVATDRPLVERDAGAGRGHRRAAGGAEQEAVSALARGLVEAVRAVPDAADRARSARTGPTSCWPWRAWCCTGWSSPTASPPLDLPRRRSDVCPEQRLAGRRDSVRIVPGSAADGRG